MIPAATTTPTPIRPTWSATRKCTPSPVECNSNNPTTIIATSTTVAEIAQ